MPKFVDFSGLISAPATPLLPNGELNLKVIKDYVKHLVDTGVYGVYVNGTTGEGPSFTVEERKNIAEAWVAAGKDKLKLIIIQVGGGCWKEAVQLAKHAESIGAHAIASLPPLFFRPKAVDDLVDYCAEIAAAAPNIPFYYYHFPTISQVNISIVEFLEKASQRVPTLGGVKYTSIDIQQLAAACKFDQGRYLIMQGYDELLGPALLAGSRAAVGASYNFTGVSANRLINSFKSGDMNIFKKEQNHLSEVLQVIQTKGEGGISTLKTAIDLVTPFPLGPPRSPLRPLNDPVRKSLAKGLESLGYKTYD